MHAVLVRLKLLFTWHCAHCVVAWVPVRAKPVVEWSNVAPIHCVVL